MTDYRIGRAAEILGVSVDMVRRFADAGELKTRRTDGGQRVVSGRELAKFSSKLAAQDREDSGSVVFAGQSARNRFSGIVTKVTKDKVMAQVEIQAGPHRVVSLLSAEAVDELGLEPGTQAVAAVKATNVIVEVPEA